MKLLRLPSVLARVPYSRSSIYAMIERGEFVKPVKIGARAIAFPEDEIDAWIAAKIVEREAA